MILTLISQGGRAEESLPTLEATPDKAALQERIKAVGQRVGQLPPGQVVIGRIVLEGNDNPEFVMSQMLILRGGYFATAVKDLSQPLTLRMHQYAPLDVKLDAKAGDIIDLGTVKMRRLVPADLVPVEGKVVLEGSDNPSQVTVTLTVSQGAVNTPTNGTEPRPRWPDAIVLRVDGSGQFQAESLSPIKYFCRMTALGYVTKEFEIELIPRDRNELGTFRLEKPRRVAMEFIVSKEGPFEPGLSRKTTVSAGTRWKALPDIYGWDLEFVQRNGKVYFKHAYGPCSIEDLGEGKLEEFLDIGDVPGQGFPEQLAVEDGHVYLVNQGHWKRKILLKAILKPPE
jgi:hypothetical protein